MSINVAHEYSDSDGLKWERVFTSPQVSFDTKLDPFSKRQFLDKTGKQKGTVGDMMDRSSELSEKRKSIAGRDPVKDEFFKSYSKNRKNKLHPSDPDRYKKLKKMGIKIT